MKQVLQNSTLALAVAAGLLASAPARAITNVEANAGPQFNFVNPGARSLGMGGAFLGLADDSTAAYTNPAGLGQLSRKEWSIEGRYTDFTTRSVKGGRLDGTPTGIGVDTDSGLNIQETDQGVTNLSFVSFAIPLEHGTVAFYRHELANFGAHFKTQGAIAGDVSTTSPPVVNRIQPSINDIDLEIVNYAAAGSWRVNSKLMLGVSLNFFQFDFNTLTQRYSFDTDLDGVVTPLERLTSLQYDDAHKARYATQNGDDSDFAFNVGLLWQPSDSWSVGAVYRQGPEFDYDNAVPPVGALPGTSGSSTFVVPDVWGLGVAYRPNDNWRIGFDATRVEYSDHSKFVQTQSGNERIDYLKLDDSTELRLGAEYTNAEARHPYSIRFGAWHQPAHQMYFDGDFIPYTGTTLTPRQNDTNARAAMFRPGKDALHLTAGYGVVFDKFQIDTAIDISRPSRVFSLSMVYYLK
jgi:long-subunit fatty acid transport protein